MKMKHYDDTHRAKISFPLGGIGSGSIGLAGNGALIDWEIFNRPNKQSRNGFSHFAVRAEKAGKVIAAKVLQGRGPADPTGSPQLFGFGVPRETLDGMPHFARTDFAAAFPLAQLAFEDPAFPGKIRLEAFNPLIPLNDFDSSLPAAFFAWEVTNNAGEELSYTLAFNVSSPWPDAGQAGFETRNGFPLLTLRNADAAADAVEYGDLTLGTDAADFSFQKYWFAGKRSLFDDLTVYWREFLRPGRFESREKGAPHSLLAAHFTLRPGEIRTVRFVLAWNIPNCHNYWQTFDAEHPLPPGLVNRWKNDYATRFADSAATAVYALGNRDRLEAETRKFVGALYDSSLPEPVLEAAGANLSVLKSPTCLRLEDGSFYGFEGCAPRAGNCEGSCSHVWSYAYALPFLFPRLERGMRDLEYRYNLQPDGGMPFRLMLPLGRENTFRPCADGQFGTIVKVYREWLLSGGDDWLKQLWPKVKRSLEYAWSPDNPDRWDPERSGVLTGRQHHTLDMELFGPNSWLTGFYLAALEAGAEMAEAVGDREFAGICRSIFRRGREFLNRELFNGTYFQQKIDLSDRGMLAPFRDGTGCVFDPGESIYDSYWDAEHGEVKYQVGDGCLIDQMLAQWHAGLVGLGAVFDREKAVSALKTIDRENFRTFDSETFNPCRLFAGDGEAGTVVCSWPPGHRRPWVPIPYAEETMTGFEYAAAGQMMQYGMIDEGLRLVRAVRDRYDGAKRNPWNEMECGSNYARSMASWALIPILSGFRCDLPHRKLRFDPAVKGDEFRCFWSCGTGWGVFRREKAETALELLYGTLELAELELPFLAGFGEIEVGGGGVAAQWESGGIVFSPPLTLKAGDTLRVR